MASKDTIRMISALADERRLKIFEILADSDRDDRKLSEMTGLDIDTVREQTRIMEEAGLLTACEDGDRFDYILDAKQVAVLTGFFELMLNKCSPPKCC